MMEKEDQKTLGLDIVREGREGWPLLECKLPRPEGACGIGLMGELPASVFLLFLIIKARVEKAVKPQVRPGSWQGSGQEGRARSGPLHQVLTCSISPTSPPSGPDS